MSYEISPNEKMVQLNVKVPVYNKIGLRALARRDGVDMGVKLTNVLAAVINENKDELLQDFDDEAAVKAEELALFRAGIKKSRNKEA